MTRALLLSASLLVLAAPAVLGQAIGLKEMSEATAECISCHKKESPALYQQWGASKHYRGNVGCFECHMADKDDPDAVNPLYAAAVRLFACEKPIVGAIHGTAAGGGLGLALVPDFRVTCAEAKFTANFVRLGIHPGFGLTHTLPRLVGQQRAQLMFYTGRRIGGEQAVEIGSRPGSHICQML